MAVCSLSTGIWSEPRHLKCGPEVGLVKRFKSAHTHTHTKTPSRPSKRPSCYQPVEFYHFKNSKHGDPFDMCGTFLKKALFGAAVRAAPNG